MGTLNKISKVLGFRMREEKKGKLRSKSHKLFTELGLARFDNGLGVLSPFLVKSLRKLENLVRNHMNDVSAVEMLLPSITDSELLKKSGRSNMTEVFKLQTREGKVHVLNPTCEESVANLFNKISTLRYNHLPCRLYQISNKFRDEIRTKCGLFRAREFVMKDLYCFDANLEQSHMTYNEIKDKYHNFFELLQVPYTCVKGSEGEIRSLYSDEFHFLSNAGDDILYKCEECGANEKLTHDQNDPECQKCKSKRIQTYNGIEVGHIFNLGTIYTKPFDATYINKAGKHELLQMSCYGLGLSRILGASVEVLSLDEEIRWPTVIAPYLLSIIPPKAGSNEENAAAHLTQEVLQKLQQQLKDDVLIDDRTLTIGKRYRTTKQLGIPFAVIIGKDICTNPPAVEVWNVYENIKNLVQLNDIIQFVEDNVVKASVHKK